MKIAHVSDIHWRGIQRHAEYSAVFERLFLQWTSPDTKELHPDVIVVTGDIFHTKTQGISPEVVTKLAWMFRNMGDIAPTIVTLGNHDGNLHNSYREDAISPIIGALNHPNITLLKKSGVHTVENFIFCNFSCFDKSGWEEAKAAALAPSSKNMVKIALYHGSISGCVLDTGMTALHGEQSINLFDGFDFAMLGDIHKRQGLAFRQPPGPARELKPWVAYAGSLIQQNYGEDQEKGWLLWDIENAKHWDLAFIPVHNQNAFVTVDWCGSVSKTKMAVCAAANRTAAAGLRVRVNTGKTLSPTDITGFKDAMAHCAEVVFNNKSKLDINAVKSSVGAVSRTNIRTNTSALVELFSEFIKQSDRKLSTQQLAETKNLIKGYVDKVKREDDDLPLRNVTWKINEVRFDNLFRYGEGNSINFSKLSGVVGLFGNNRIGKSSIIGSLMFGLFNTTDRGPVKSSYIINKNKTAARCEVDFTIGDTSYSIEREVEKAVVKRKGVVDEEKAATKLNLFLQTGSEKIPQTDDSRTDTDKVLRKLIGTSQDFLLTALASQGGMSKFIEEGPTVRKAILNRFLDIDVFDKFYSLVSGDLAAITAVLKGFSLADAQRTVEELDIKYKRLTEEAAALKEKLEQQRETLALIKAWLDAHSGLESLSEEVSIAEKEVNHLETLLETQSATWRRRKQEADSITTSLQNIEQRTVLEEKLVGLQATRQQIVALEKELGAAQIDVKTAAADHAQKTKSVVKLTVVPCGDQYPQCLFIRDSHEDKALLEPLGKKLQLLEKQLSVLQSKYSLLNPAAVDNDIAQITAVINNRSLLEHKKTAAEREIELITQNIASTSETLYLKKQRLDTLRAKSNEVELYDEKHLSFKNKKAALEQLEKTYHQIVVEVGAVKTQRQAIFEEIQKMTALSEQFATLEILQYAFSKNGIPAMVLKNLLPAINEEMQNLLSGVVDFVVSLDTQVDSNTLDLFIQDNNSKRVLELASGMEKMICSLALRAALINLTPLPKCDMFIIDEGFGALDDEGAQKCMALLTALKTRFRIILIVSHIQQMKEVADTILEIENDGIESHISI